MADDAQTPPVATAPAPETAAAPTKGGSTLGNALSNVMSGNAETMESPKVGHLPRFSRNISASGKGSNRKVR